MIIFIYSKPNPFSQITDFKAGNTDIRRDQESKFHGRLTQKDQVLKHANSIKVFISVKSSTSYHAGNVLCC